MVFFDAGGTLLRPREDVATVYSETAGRYGLDAGRDAVMASFFAAFHEQKLDGKAQDRAWWRTVVARTFAGFGQASDPEALFDDLYAHFHDPASWELFPRALETIGALRARGYRTGLISNWDDRLPELLDGLALTPLLDPVVISYDVGAEKPHRRIFERALGAAHLPPEKTVMIGDDYEADVQGASALGMRAVQIRREGQRANGEPVVDDLIELLDLLPGVNGSS
jgi:putative hydrolase of the HAD superfamily